VNDLLRYWQAQPGQGPSVNLDVGGVNRAVGLTHFFRTPKQALITSAKVTFHITGSDVFKNDGIFYNQTAVPASGLPLPLVALRDLLGREPQPGEVLTLQLDLAKAPLRTIDTTGGAGGSWTGSPNKIADLLSMLNADQRLDLVFADDTTVDFSQLSVTYALPTDPRGDLNGDGSVNLDDLEIITNALNTDAYTNDPRDLDHDGRISVLDARQLVLLCSKPLCAR